MTTIIRHVRIMNLMTIKFYNIWNVHTIPIRLKMIIEIHRMRWSLSCLIEGPLLTRISMRPLWDPVGIINLLALQYFTETLNNCQTQYVYVGNGVKIPSFLISHTSFQSDVLSLIQRFRYITNCAELKFACLNDQDTERSIYSPKKACICMKHQSRDSIHYFTSSEQLMLWLVLVAVHITTGAPKDFLLWVEVAFGIFNHTNRIAISDVTVRYTG